jgi:ribosomal protein S18 acetylase RimI-like enzyme
MTKQQSFDYEIISATSEHLDRIAEIHLKTLPDDFCSLLGYKFLKSIYYPTLMKAEKSIGLCAIKGDDVCGYVFFVNDKQFTKNVFFNQFFKILTISLPKLLSISFIRYVISIFILLFYRKSNSIEKNGYELNYIAVAYQYQGNGIGKKLVYKGLTMLASMESEFCWLKTLKHTPKTIKFYKDMGFKIYDEFLGRVYLCKKLIGECSLFKKISFR